METLDELCRAARAAFAARERGRAVEIMARACDEYAGDPRAWRDAAGLRVACGEIDAALACFDRAAAVSATPAAELYEKGVLLARVNRRDEALAVYREVVRLDPAQADAWINMGAILDDRGEPIGAIECYERVLASAPNDAMAWANRGNSLTQLGRFDEAIASYDRAIELEDDDAVRLRCRALLHAGRVDEANRVRATKSGEDPGEARERRRDGLVARYFIGQHSNPELLDRAVERFLELTARCRDTPKGIREGSVLQLGWAVITLAREGDALVLCEPDWSRDPRCAVRRELTFVAQQQVMAHAIHHHTRAGFEDCTCHDTLRVDAQVLASPRVYMRRIAKARAGESGWIITGDRVAAPPSSTMPMSALASRRPHLLKCVSLPVGYCAQFDAHAVTTIWDATDRVCLQS